MKIHEHVWDIFVSKKEDGLYSIFWKDKRLTYLSSKDKKKCLSWENENQGFRGNIDFDLQNTGQSHYFDENLEWSHGHYGHFAQSGFP